MRSFVKFKKRFIYWRRLKELWIELLWALLFDSIDLFDFDDFCEIADKLRVFLDCSRALDSLIVSHIFYTEYPWLANKIAHLSQ